MEIPEHQATIEMGLKQLQDKWKMLSELIHSQKEKMKYAREYFQLAEHSEKFIRETNKLLLEWSRRLSAIDDDQGFDAIRKDMENYTKLNKTQQNEILVRMTAAAGQVFGPSAIYKTQVVQKEQEETFNAINTILLQACDMQTKMKSRKDEEMKRLQNNPLLIQVILLIIFFKY